MFCFAGLVPLSGLGRSVTVQVRGSLEDTCTSGFGHALHTSVAGGIQTARLKDDQLLSYQGLRTIVSVLDEFPKKKKLQIINQLAWASVPARASCQNMSQDQEDTDALWKFWNTPELIEKLLSYLNAAATKCLAEAHNLTQETNNGSFGCCFGTFATTKHVGFIKF